MKYFLFILLIFFCSKSFAQNNSADTIHWRSDYCLKWEDFEGKPDDNSTALAASEIAITCVAHHITDSTVEFIIKTVFYKKKSWAKLPIVDSGYVLMHEQGHFDLAQIYAQKLQSMLKKFTVMNYSSNKIFIHKEMNKAYLSVVEECNAIDAIYDEETGHAVVWGKQEEWNKRNRLLLKGNKDLN